MKKKNIIESFEFPTITDDINTKLDKLYKDDGVILIDGFTKIVNHEKVDIITFYIKAHDFYKKTYKKVVRQFITKNDFLYQYRIEDEIYTGKREPYLYYNKAMCHILNDKTEKLINRLNDKLNSDYQLNESHRIVTCSIYQIKGLQSNNRAKKRHIQEKSEAEIDMHKFRHIEPFVPVKIKKEAVKKFPVYFFEEQGEMYCTNCKKEHSLDKLDKHKTARTCPSCKAKGIVQRTSMCKSMFNDHHYMMQAEIIDGNIIVNYYLCQRTIYKGEYKNEDITISNSNRQMIDMKNGHIKLYYAYKKYFMPINKSICHTNFDPYAGLFRNVENKYYCGKNYLTSETIELIQNAEGYDFYNQYYLYEEDRITNLSSEDFYKDVLEALYVYHTGTIIEKMIKYGIGHLVNDFALPSYLRPSIDLNRRATELNKIFRLNKPMMSFIKEHRLDWFDIRSLQNIYSSNIPFIPERALICMNTIGLSVYKDYWNKVRLLNYFNKQYQMGNSITHWEYKHYLENLEKLNIPKYKSYLYPKDFYEYDRLISRKLDEKVNSAQVKAIHIISDGLRNMEGIEKFMGDSQGLLVKVPESPADLREEGISLDNCIGSYISRIASGNTFIFFIRQANAPNKPFFAMEYHKGEIRQIHGFKNCNPNKEIKSFCQNFAKFLKMKKFEPKKLLEAA